jgi:ubiquinone/menaquinone biosynthesis C-methylase UbiE
MTRSLYDAIGAGYDATRKADPEIARRLRHLLQVRDGSEVLDVACGTGNYTTALRASGLRMCGVDVSPVMLEAARRKSDETEWILADAADLPIPDVRFAGAVCVLGIHHFPDLSSCFREMCRVLRPGSRLVLFTASPEQMMRYWLNHYFPEMMRRSIAGMPGIAAVREALTESGFRFLGAETFLVQPDLQDLFLYSGKHRPELYFDLCVRKGISSFAAPDLAFETEEGLRRLEADLRDGAFSQVFLDFVSEWGDYLFVVAEKGGDNARS